MTLTQKDLSNHTDSCFLGRLTEVKLSFIAVPGMLLSHILTQ